MAVVALDSQVITDLDASPRVIQNPRKLRGNLYENVGVITTNADDSIASVYRFTRLPSHARVSSVIGMLNVGSATAGAGDVGLYDVDSGAVVDADFFASAWDFNVLGNTPGVELIHEADSGFLVDEAEKELWDALGLSSDPGIEYDVAITLTEAIATAACVLGMKVKYVT